MPSSQAITLWIPNCLNPNRLHEVSETIAELKLPALQSILAKSDSFSAKPQSHEATASYLWHQPNTLAAAATTALAEIDAFDEKVFWLRVDPVQMIPDRDALIMVPSDDLGITEEESKALLATFNKHFLQDQVQLEYGALNRWYLRIVQAVDIETTPLAKAAYQNVNDLYPKGNAATYWHQLMNEVQMLFYTHPVNETRREQGMPEINSVWVWGEGQLDSSTVHLREDSMIHSQDPYLAGLAKASKSSFSGQKQPKNYQAWSILAQKQPKKHHFIHLNETAESFANITEEAFIETLKQLEEDWFVPLLTAVKQGDIHSLLLELGDGQRHHLETAHCKRFWRFKKSLTRLAKSPS